MIYDNFISPAGPPPGMSDAIKYKFCFDRKEKILMKLKLKRIFAFIITIAMIVPLVPTISLPASAATLSGLSDTTIGLAGTASNWTVGTNSLSGSVTGSKVWSYYFSTSETLTITNNKSDAAILSFDFTASGNFAVGSTVTVDGTEYTAATTASYSKELAAGGSITIKLAADRCNESNGANTVSIAITNLSLVLAGAGTITTTFEAPAYGSYTVAYGDTTQTISAGSAAVTADNEATVQYTLTANPGTGYKLVGWYNVTTGAYISTDTTYKAPFDTPCTIKPIIVPTSTAVFKVGSEYFTDLDDAVTYAQANSINQITLVSSGTISDASYTIPAGYTLLIPRNSSYGLMGAEPTETDSYITPTNYVTLTLAENTKLNVSGTVEVSSQHFDCQGANPRYGGSPSGPYGAIYMTPGSNITLASGAILYAWGYVYGEGTVTAQNGSKVYEYMQILDFPGGSNLSDITQCFPIAQYYVQNIEVALTLEYGAQEILYSSVTAASMTFGMPVTFLATSGAMFVPSEGTSVTKRYDPSTDRSIYDVNGDMMLQSVVVDLPTGASLVGLPSSLDSSEYILGINGNMTINIHSGTTTICQDVALFPGTEITIDSGATLHLASGDSSALTVSGNSGGYNAYVYDSAEWGTYIFPSAQLVVPAYSPTSGRYKRTASDLKDVVIDVNGTITTDGFLYTTAGGAAIKSTQKSGKIVMNNGAGTETAMFQLDGTGNTKKQISVTSAQLQHGDGTYLQTSGAAAGTTYNYCSTHDRWYTGSCGCCDGNHTPGAAATCTTAQTCTVCGETIEAALGHTEVVDAAVDPTCTTTGLTEGKLCSVCGTVTVAQTEVAALDHSYDAGVVTTAPSCTAEGVKTYTCQRTGCGHSYTEAIEKTAHTPGADATCTTAQTCTVCGTEIIAALGHTEVVDAAVDPTCTATGLTEGKHCSVCNTVIVAQNVVAKLDHDYQITTTWSDDKTACTATRKCSRGCGLSETANATVTVSYTATCLDGGDKIYTATFDVGWATVATASETVDALGHFFAETVPAVSATCVSVGNSAYKQCTRCELYFASNATEDSDDGNNDTSSFVLAMLEHSYTGAIKSDGNGNGATHSFKCVNGCNTYGGATEHTWNEGVVTTEPKCTTEGVKTYTCTVGGCGATYTEAVDKKNHTEADPVQENVIDATCEAAGSYDEVVYCSDCKAELERTNSTIAALGHKDDNKDHACDNGCDVYQGTHADSDKDHACDYGCSEKIGTCEDTNKDHTCDYGCGKIYGTCEDKDLDHDCDYGCTKVYGTCEDTNKDHHCDYGAPGTLGIACSKYFGQHSDSTTDRDHVCDYGCGVTLETCSDITGDQDHNCDVCGEENITTHTYGDATCEAPQTCSECGATTGEALGHLDENTDHVCDRNCGKTDMGTHEDTGKDHKCDYGCSVAIGTCEDKDSDHKCDYGCSETYGEHKDEAPKDHACDYGCSETIGECKDGDKDHDCDYGCKKVYGEHIDANKDHVCDYGCKVAIGECVDTDNDHYCDYGAGSEDGCRDYFGSHTDSADDKDHVCDYCKKEVENGEPCTDVNTDNDHNCDVCGKEDVTDHKHSTYGCDDDYHWSVCTCEAAIEETKVEHSFENGACICGLPEIEVECWSEAYYEVSGRVVTVSYEFACKVGYFKGDAYVALEATENADGSYSFKAPVEADKVLILVKGDANLDGRVTAADIARINAAVLGKTTLTAEMIFAGDVNGDGKANAEDFEDIKADVLKTASLKWN